VALIPLYDNNPLRHIRYPYVTWALLAINVGVFLFVEGAGMDGVDQASAIEFGLIPAVFDRLAERPVELAAIPSALTLLTYAFFHGNFWHLLGNMVFLWVFADNVEDALGHLRFLVFYCLSAIGGGCAYILSAPSSESPLIGASGAIAGIIAAYFMLTPYAKVWILVLGPIPVRLRALWVLGFWIAFQVYSALTGRGDSQIAWWTHVGGLVTGAVLVLFLRRRDVPLFASADPGVPAPPIEPREIDGPWGRR
jgi:membrane associated rhomboid family serine protease